VTSGANIEDILALITGKMDSLSTGSDSRQQMFDAFVSVLNVEKEYAEFFLESAAWQLDVAVSLCLENMGSVDAAVRQTFSESVATEQAMQMWAESYSTASAGDGSGNHGDGMALEGTHDHKRRQPHTGPAQNRVPSYPSEILHISGLIFPWMARISKTRGTVVFHNQQTGQSQHEWPGWHPPAAVSIRTEAWSDAGTNSNTVQSENQGPGQFVGDAGNVAGDGDGEDEDEDV